MVKVPSQNEPSVIVTLLYESSMPQTMPKFITCRLFSIFSANLFCLLSVDCLFP